MLRERAPISIGSGISDSYQPVERDQGLMRECASILAEHPFPVSLLTKSSLVLRDSDVWEKVNRGHGFILIMTVTTLDEEVRRRFEPGASPITERLATLRAFHERGIPIGVMAMPLLPFIADGEQDIRALVGALKDAGAARDAGVPFLLPRALFMTGDARTLLGNEKLAAFLRSIAIERRVFDYITLTAGA